MNRIVMTVVYLWLAGVLVILFCLGYCLFGVLWIVRFMQMRKWLRASVFTVTLIVAAGVLVWFLLFPWKRSQESVTVVIPKGGNVRAIADTLVQYRIITAAAPFLAWLRLSGIEHRIQAGKFTFNPGEGALSASRRLMSAAPLDTLVTVPEGFTIEQTARRIGSILTIDTAAFIDLCNDTSFIRELGLGNEPSLEGYLFPDSYWFEESEEPQEIIRRMVNRFLAAYQTLDTASPNVASMSRRDIVTLASIVEKEAALASERPRIAAVFHNRLRIGLPLGADPTVRYLLRKFNGPLYKSELTIASPYNTRRYTGLPPSPICSPGLASLSATVSPLKTNELYFVAKWDGSGAHEFSLTNEEHTRKKLKIRREHQKRLQQKGKQ
ncbi:MAG: endolytic transglycosylase MltG [Chitinispirillaceae bacterium]|nr:endolytic transglycosylase MltG [Chitinispirillaceae bacterium]